MNGDVVNVITFNSKKIFSSKYKEIDFFNKYTKEYEKLEIVFERGYYGIYHGNSKEGASLICRKTRYKHSFMIEMSCNIDFGFLIALSAYVVAIDINESTA